MDKGFYELICGINDPFNSTSDHFRHPAAFTHGHGFDHTVEVTKSAVHRRPIDACASCDTFDLQFGDATSRNLEYRGVENFLRSAVSRFAFAARHTPDD